MDLTWSRIDSFAGNSTSPALTAYRPCPLCGSAEARAVHSMDAVQFYSDSADEPKRADVCVQKCARCFALFLNPCYSEYGFRVLFAEAGQSYGATEGRPAEQLRWLSERGLLDPGKSALDVGCYDGRFLGHMPAHVRRVGVDIDLPAIERGRRELNGQGVELRQGDFETFRCDFAPDAITLFHVLEHLPRPVAVLQKLRSLAHPGTRLAVEVPILENGAADAITGFFSPQHTTHFSRASLRNALAASGWSAQEWVEQPDYNGCRVLAAPTDPRPALQPGRDDLAALCDVLESWYRALAAVNRRLAAVGPLERCVVWGGGMHSEYLYQTTRFFREMPERELAVVDSDPLKHGKTWRGLTIHPPASLRGFDWSGTSLVISSYGSQASIARAALELGVPRDRLVTLYQRPRVY